MSSPQKLDLAALLSGLDKPLWLVAIARRKVVLGHYWNWHRLRPWPIWKPVRTENWSWEGYEACRLRAHSEVNGNRLSIVPDDSEGFVGPDVAAIYAVSVQDDSGRELLTSDLQLSSKIVTPGSSIYPNIGFEF